MKELKIEIRIRSCAYEELSEEERRLIDAAKEATKLCPLLPFPCRSSRPACQRHHRFRLQSRERRIPFGHLRRTHHPILCQFAIPRPACKSVGNSRPQRFRLSRQPDSPLRRMPPSVVGDRATLWASHAHPPLQQSGNLLPKRSQKSPPPLLRRWVPEVICLHSASHLYACSYSTESSHNPNRQGLQSRYYKDCNPDLIKQQS